MAARLRARLRDQDLVAREGGDEFLVLLADIDADAEQRALKVAESLVEALRAPIELGDTEFEVNGSVGISVYPRDASDAEGLLAHADTAMYDAKSAGRGQVCSFRGRRDRSSERLSLSRRLRRAIEGNELILHWQPIVRLEPGVLTGAEALVRWNDPQRGLLAAGEFVGDMEAAGLLDQLDEWVALAFTAQRREWNTRGLDPYVGFNLGPRALTAGRVERMLDCLDPAHTDLTRVTVEISEGEILRDDSAVRWALHRLHSSGVTLALDDFGVAYSSLSRLRDLPTDWIKVDRSFLAGVPGDPAAVRILDAILALLDALGSRVIVEGVETAAQVGHLLARGCETAQGYFLGRPMPAAQLEGLLLDSPDAQMVVPAASGPVLAS
jgi:predicted signal transduction protein with EAL and GGDEF domain